ncbi:MAG TPA: hypothetical protein PLV52_07320, partial [Candidatus Omnitrophota bacterium]|nr:hypothetical protein [Candidatus Omnitrophota bacterium]
YYDYIRTYDTIKKDELFPELAALENALKEKLFRNDDERRLDSITKDLSIIRNILNVTAAPDEFRFYSDNKIKFDPEKINKFIEDSSLSRGLEIQPIRDLSQITDQLSGMEKFYELSYKRDDSFVRNLKKGGGNAVVLVTGGFHGGNLAGIFKERGINYISILPNFRLDDAPCPYFKRLAGEEPAIFKSVSSKRSAIALYTYFCEAAKDIYGEDVEILTDSWIEIIAELLSGEKADAGAGFSLLASDSIPEISGAGYVEEVPGALINGKKVYAIWQVQTGDSSTDDGDDEGYDMKPSWVGSKVVRVLVFLMISISALISSFARVTPVSAASIDSSSVPAVTNMSSAGQLYKVVDKMWEDPDIAGILSQYEATDKPHKVQAMADLSLDYFSKIPPSSRNLYIPPLS